MNFGEIAQREENCEKHGKFLARNFLKIWTKCPVCAKEFQEAEKAEEAMKAKEAAQIEWQKKLGESGIPERFKTRSIAKFVATTQEQREALDFANAYADSFDNVLKNGRSAVFIGKPGTGKTHLACGIALRIMHRDKRTALFTSVLRMIRRIKSSWHKTSTESEAQAIKVFTYPDLLILDEVGVQFDSETEKLFLTDILDQRYGQNKPTIFISNEDREKVKEFLGERIVRRLREDGGQFIPFNWESHV